MKRFCFAALTSLGMLAPLAAWAHEGHDKTPGSVTAPNGGAIKGTSNLFVEVVYEAGKIKLFFYDHEMKKVPSRTIKVSSSLKLPKAKKGTNLKLASVADHLEANVDTKGAHRFELNVTINKNEKSERISFNIEP